MTRIRIGTLFLTALTIGTFAAPAWATRWAVTLDPWIWIDLDSVQVKDGISYYAIEHSSGAGIAPDDMTPSSQRDLNDAVNCVTGEIRVREMLNRGAYYSESYPHHVVPQYQWKKFETDSQNAEMFKVRQRIVCKQS